jgi:hypothetical protein
MGMIVGTKQVNNENSKVLCEVLLDYDEITQLQGHMNNVYLFSEHSPHIKTSICARGKNAATKYFLIPRELRRNIRFGREGSCRKIELKDKVIFVYIIDKY